MKEKTFIAILCVAAVVLGSLVLLAETCLLVYYGVTLEMALIDSLYTGFLGWITLVTVILSTDRFWKLTDKIIKK